MLFISTMQMYMDNMSSTMCMCGMFLYAKLHR